MAAKTTQQTVIEMFIEATRVRRALETELHLHGISFALWWVLYVTDLMGVLSERALVDRGPDGLDRGYRILTTSKGRTLIAATEAALGTGLSRARALPSDPSRALAYCLARAQIDE